MKKIIFFLLIINVCKAQYFNGYDDLYPINSKQYLKGNVKSVKRFFYNLSSFDTSQKSTATVFKIDNQDYYYGGFNEDSFDVAGHLLTRKHFNQFFKLLKVEKYTYNDSFKLLSITVTTETNRFSIFEGTYNNFTLEKELLSYDDDGTLTTKSVFYYNINNTLDYV